MRITSPRGVVPKARGCNLPENYAAKAENLNTQSNRFEPWRQPLELLTFPERTLSIHVRDCCWTGDSDPNTTYVDAGVDRKTYRSHPCKRPMVTDSVCDPYWTYLGYPVPNAPLVFSDLGEPATKGPDTETRTYVITYGTECEEGPASCPSDPVEVTKDSLVGIQLPASPDCLWGSTHVRVYCSSSLWDSSQGLMDFQSPVQEGYLSPSTEQKYFLVAEMPIAQRQFVHSQELQPGRTLLTQDHLPAPECSQVAGETELGSLVIFWDKSIAFSERNRHWGFPLKTWHDFPFEVKDVKVCNNTVFVLTSGAVYVIQDDVDCRDSSSRQVLEVKGDNAPAPCVSCVELPDGVLYTSQVGLVYLRIDGSQSLVSENAFEKDDWNQLGPIRELTIACGMLILSTHQEDLLWELSFDEAGNLPADLTTLSFPVDDWQVDDQGHLYFLSDNTVYQFNAGPDYLSMDWLQAEQRTGDRQRTSAIDADYVKKNPAEGNTVSVYRNGGLSVVKELTGTPRKIRNTSTKCFQIRVKGPKPMCSLSYGQGFNDLSE